MLILPSYRTHASADRRSAPIAPLDLQVKLWQCSTMPPSGDARPELLSGTLELIVLRTLTVMGSQHAYGIAARIEQVAEQAIRLNQGTLYPALVRLEQKGWIKGSWQTTKTIARRSTTPSRGRASGHSRSRQPGGSAPPASSTDC